MKKILNLAVFLFSATALTTTGFAGRNIADDHSVVVTTLPDPNAIDPNAVTDGTDSTDATGITAQNGTATTATSAVATPPKNGSSGFSGGALALMGIGGVGAGILLTKKGVVDKVGNKIGSKIPEAVKNKVPEAVKKLFTKKSAPEPVRLQEMHSIPAASPKAAEHEPGTPKVHEQQRKNAEHQPRSRERASSVPREKMRTR